MFWIWLSAGRGCCYRRPVLPLVHRPAALCKLVSPACKQHCHILRWHFLKGQVGAGKLFLFSAAAAFAANGVFAVVYPQSESVGGSPVVFSSIGLILAMQLLSKKGPRFSLQPAYGKWIAGYAVLGNIPVFSGNISTLIIHSIAFVLGAAAGAAAIKLASLKMDKQIQPRQE